MNTATEPKPAAKRPRRMAREPMPVVVAEPSQPLGAEAATQPKRQTKAAQVEALLIAGEGATLEELCAATGWQAHTCRAFLTGLRNKGRAVVRGKRGDGVTSYRLGNLSVPTEKVPA